MDNLVPHHKHRDGYKVASDFMVVGWVLLHGQFSIDSRGKSSDAKASKADPDTPRVRSDAQNAVRAMQFRPRLVQNIARRTTDATMNYLYPSNR